MSGTPEGASLYRVRSGGRTLEIRRLETVREVEPLVDLQAQIWGYGRPGADFPYPVRALFALSQSGGLVAGAFLDESLVGFAVAWLGLGSPDGSSFGRYHLHSQILGVLPGYRQLGVAYHLKLFQRRFALERGLERMRWTFDPLQSPNARLNLNKLGGVAQCFLPEFYGSVRSELSEGLASDRIWVDWYVSSPRVEARLAGRAPQSGRTSLPCVTRVQTGVKGLPELVDYALNRSDADLLVEIPTDFASLRRVDPSLAFDWQLKLRQIFTRYLARGYTVDEFWVVEEPVRRNYYRFTTRPLEELLSRAG